MIGMGTIINVIGIIAGGFIGMIFGKKMTDRYQETLMSGISLCVLFLGIAGCIQEIFVMQYDRLESQGTMMMIASFALGAIVGEWLNLELRIEQFGCWLKKISKSDKDIKFVDAFVTASLTVCIGAMAVVGSIQDGIAGNYDTLAAKAALDLVIILVMTASMGKGCIFSAIPVGLFQGSITLLSKLIEPLMTPQALSNLSLTGSILIFCVGVNLIWGKKIKVANLLPTIVFAVIFSYIKI